MKEKRERLHDLLCKVGQLQVTEVCEYVEQAIFWVDDIDDLREADLDMITSEVEDVLKIYG